MSFGNLFGTAMRKKKRKPKRRGSSKPHLKEILWKERSKFTFEKKGVAGEIGMGINHVPEKRKDPRDFKAIFQEAIKGK